MHQNFLFLLRFIRSLKCDNIDIVFMEARETQLLEFNFINLKKTQIEPVLLKLILYLHFTKSLKRDSMYKLCLWIIL